MTDRLEHLLYLVHRELAAQDDPCTYARAFCRNLLRQMGCFSDAEMQRAGCPEDCPHLPKTNLSGS